ncbi:short-chain dehydrogenase/reductase-like protein SDR [Thermoascus aurantiacus ATCC 26904]
MQESSRDLLRSLVRCASRSSALGSTPLSVSGISGALVTLSGAQGIRTLPSFSLEGKTCVEFPSACVDITKAAGEASIKHIAEHVAASQPSEPVPELKAYACDVTQEAQVKETFAQIVRDFGNVDVVATAAGIVDNVEAENYEHPRWRRMLNVNLDGTFLFAREAGKHMLENRLRGSIILIGSMSGQICVRPQKQAAYNASKGAVAMLAKSLATDHPYFRRWGPSGIRVNCLSPGYMETDLIRELLTKQGKELVNSWIRDIPLGRMAHPSEMQGAAVWIASDASSYLNGSDIIIDGGYTAY